MKKLSILIALSVSSLAFADLTTVEITSENIGNYASSQTASWIGGDIYGLDFGNGYGPNSYANFTAQQGTADGSSYFYKLSASVLNQGFDVEGETQYIKKITAGGGSYANSLFIVDADYDFNVFFYQNPQYKNEAGEKVNYTTVSSDGTVYGAAVQWNSNSDGSFNKITASAQDMNLTGMAVVLDFSEALANGVKEGSASLLSYASSGKYSSSNSFYFTLDGRNYVECVAGTGNVNDYTYNLDGVMLDFERTTVDGVTTLNLVYSVPEPSTYAAVFGALALGFAMYRRRK